VEFSWKRFEAIGVDLLVKIEGQERTELMIDHYIGICASHLFPPFLSKTYRHLIKKTQF
jgi:hypothetical protein